MTKRLYFGHPVNTYDTEFERDLLRRIAGFFPEWEIVNPNSEVHEAGYQRYVKLHGGGMGYFFEAVLPSCHGGIFLPFRDGAWGKGVYGEAENLVDRGLPVWVIDHLGWISSLIDPNAVRVLTVDETRARIRNADRSRKEY